MQEHKDNGADIARQHEEQEQESKRATIEEASRMLGRVLERHKAGEPVLAEMAARIEARAMDPNGLLG